MKPRDFDIAGFINAVKYFVYGDPLTGFTLLLNRNSHVTQPIKVWGNHPLLRFFVSVEQWSCVEQVLNYPVKGLSPVLKFMSSVGRALFTTCVPGPHDSEHRPQVTSLMCPNMI